ncbi:AsnC family transcriptional regulator [Natronobiforma cellulositropha]|uniref:AsnC family transcriptional regulator n=1 Tax=Natronobiforma cellulositropha TaxID=1679076 RepID=UPI0021D6045E|nr:AsnC family transcriptional regulator [Natronobiforma cellulositropha]
MRTLDETDLNILRLLVEDARRPYSDIADRVDVSAPTVSDRIDRLSELGVINGFTVDLDRTTFTDGIDVLIDVELRAGTDDRLVDRVAAIDAIEHVFVTADARLLAVATAPIGRIRDILAEGIDLEFVDSYRVHLVEERRWQPTIGSAELALSCDECENTVTSEGVSLRLGGDLYHFCCPTCRSNFENRYASLTESV